MSTTFTTLFGEHPDVRVLEFLATHAEFDYNVTDLSRNAGVSRPAAYRVLDRLTAQGLVVRTRRVGASWFYALNRSSPYASPLMELEGRLGAAAAAGGRVGRRGRTRREVKL